MYSASFILKPGDRDAEFDRLHALIDEAARATDGFLRAESWRAAEGTGRNAVYYWASLEALRAFSTHPRHLEAKRQYGEWYSGYQIVVAQVLRSYGDDAFEHLTPNARRRPCTQLTLRETLQAGDIGEITRLHGAEYSVEHGHGIAFEAYVAAGLAEFFHAHEPSRDRVWLYQDGNRIVGMLLLMHRDESAQLRYFLVLPAYRGQGLGKDLMARYMAALDDLGCDYSFLWTTNELTAAASLYTRHGFRLCEERSSTRFGKPLVEQKYEWRRA